MQSSIAIVIAIPLSVLGPWPHVDNRQQKKHIQALMMATVDFHLAQCYFAAAIQIAAVVFTARDYLLVRQIASPEVLDVGLLITLATNGFASIILTLALITRYERQSWYLISLSSIIFISSTGMLAASYNAWYATPFDPAYGVLQACGDFLASNWSFGQILAVVIWAPCLVEFVNLEIS